MGIFIEVGIYLPVCEPVNPHANGWITLVIIVSLFFSELCCDCCNEILCCIYRGSEKQFKDNAGWLYTDSADKLYMVSGRIYVHIVIWLCDYIIVI